MPKVLAQTIDGRITYCTCEPEQRGKGRCNHVLHQEEGESAQAFVERAQTKVFAEESESLSPAKTNEAITKPWNQDTLSETREILADGNCCIINQATGTGKSSIMSAIIDDYYDQQSLFISPQLNINSAFQGHNANSRSAALGNLNAITYQSLLNIKSKKDLETFCKDNGIDLPIKVLCLDEIHHLTADSAENKKWKEAVERLIKFGTDENTIFVGASATVPDSSAILDGRFTDKVSANMSFEQAVERGILKMPNIISRPNMDDFEARYDKQSEAIRKRSKLTGVLPNIRDKEAYIRRVNEEFETRSREALAAKIAENDAAGKSTNILVFSPTVEGEEGHLQEAVAMIQKANPNKKIKAFVYDSKEGRANQADFDKFCSGGFTDKDTIYICATCNTLNEGVHTNASIIIQNRPTTSKSLHDQQQGRVLDMNSSEHNLIIDNVGTYSGSKFHNYSSMSSTAGTTYSCSGYEEMIKFDYLSEYSAVYNTQVKQAQKSYVSWKPTDLAKTHLISGHRTEMSDPKFGTFTSVKDINIGHFTMGSFFPQKCQTEVANWVRDCKLSGKSSQEMAKGIFEICSKYPEYQEYLKIIDKK